MPREGGINRIDALSARFATRHKARQNGPHRGQEVQRPALVVETAAAEDRRVAQSRSRLQRFRKP